MDATAIGNAFMDSGRATAHPCGRCVNAFADGQYRYLGQVGCLMPTFEDQKKSLFAGWSADGGEEHFCKCLRCFILGQECVAASIPPLYPIVGYTDAQ